MDRLLAATAAVEDHHFWFKGLRRHARLMLDQAGVRPGLRLVVDCGAGTGRNLEWLATYGPAIGVDLSPYGIEVARRRGRPIVRGSVTALPVRTAAADLATSFDVLYCMDDRGEQQTLDEMWRILRPGGVALVNTAALAFLRGSHSTLSDERRRYTPAQLRRSLERAGFVVERVTFTNMSVFPPALLRRGWEQITGRASVPSDADLHLPPAPVNRFFDWCLTVESRILPRMNLPVGTSVMAVARKVDASGRRLAA
jgi:SAM-dependent methyltransferase